MLSVLFWNVMGRRIESLCANIVRRHGVDILALAECPHPPAVIRAVNQQMASRCFRWHRTASRVCVFSRFPRLEFQEVVADQRYSIHALSGQNREELLFVSVHATSGLRVSEIEQETELRKLAERLASVETARGHTRTLLVGDLNADPYDRRVQAAIGLHAEKSRPIALQGSRRVRRVAYRFFYNPMWRFLGQQPPEPQGTYYRRKAEHATRFWHVFDQVLLRPALLPYFDDSDVSVLRDDGTTSFQKSDGTPDKKVASDHYPILIKLAYPGV